MHITHINCNLQMFMNMKNFVWFFIIVIESYFMMSLVNSLHCLSLKLKWRLFKFLRIFTLN